MVTKSTTQKLDIRWQDRVWQPRIRRVAAGRTRSVASSSSNSRAPVTETPVTARRPCRRIPGGMNLIQRVLSSVVPHRGK